MALILDGTNGINSSGVIVAPDGSASAPSITNDGDTNTGIFFPAADTIGFVCGGTEDFRVDSTGQLWNTVESQVGTDYTTLYKGYFCRAWVNFNGSGTVAIRASGNVSSITDNGTGNYTVNFTTAMPDSDYSCVTTACDAGGARGTLSKDSYSTTSATLSALRFTTSVSVVDFNDCNVAIFR